MHAAANSESAKTLKLHPAPAPSPATLNGPRLPRPQDPDPCRPARLDPGKQLVPGPPQSIDFISQMKTPPPKRWLAPQTAARPAEDSRKAVALERFNDNKLIVKEILATLQGLHSDLRMHLQVKEELQEQVEALEGRERALASKIDSQHLRTTIEIEQLEKEMLATCKQQAKVLEEIADLKLQLAKQQTHQAPAPVAEKETASQSFGRFQEGSFSGRPKKKK